MANIHRYQEGSFQKIAGTLQLKRIAVADPDNVWGIDHVGKIWRFDQAKGQFVQKAVGQTLLHIAVGAGSVWGVGQGLVPYQWDGSKFSKVGGSVQYIGVPIYNGTPWGRNGKTILRFNSNSKAFEPVPGSYKFLAVGDDDTVWALAEDGWPCMWDETKFVRRNDEGLRLTYVAPGRSHVYGISPTERVYKATPVTGSTGGWVQPNFEGGLISPNGRLVYLDTGILEVSGQGGSAGIDMVWGLNSAGKAYYLENGKWTFRGGPFSKLAVGIGTLQEKLDGGGQNTGWVSKFNVWALE